MSIPDRFGVAGSRVEGFFRSSPSPHSTLSLRIHGVSRERSRPRVRDSVRDSERTHLACGTSGILAGCQKRKSCAAGMPRYARWKRALVRCEAAHSSGVEDLGHWPPLGG